MATKVSRFAHLFAAKKAEEESDEDRRKREEQEAKGKKGKADDGGEETDEERKKREEEEENARKSKGKKADEDGDDESAEDDDEDKKDEKASAARLRERARCAAIFAHPAAARRPDLAAHLAFEQGLNRREARAMLEMAAGSQPPAAPSAPARGGLSERMRHSPNPDLGAPGGESAEMAPWQRMAAARKAVRGER